MHPSVAVGVAKVNTALQVAASVDMVVSDGHPAKTGEPPSVTVTEKLQLSMLPKVSAAVKVIMVTPIGNALPLGGPAVWVTVAGPVQLSVGAGVAKVTTAVHTPGSVGWVISAGQTSGAGGEVSFRNTVKEHDEALPLGSVAVRVTVCTVPKPEMMVPGAGAWVMVGVSQLSNAKPEFLKSGIAALQFASVNKVSFPGHTSSGGVVSLTCTENEQEAVLPAWSIPSMVTILKPTTNVFSGGN